MIDKWIDGFCYIVQNNQQFLHRDLLSDIVTRFKF